MIGCEAIGDHSKWCIELNSHLATPVAFAKATVGGTNSLSRSDGAITSSSKVAKSTIFRKSRVIDRGNLRRQRYCDGKTKSASNPTLGGRISRLA